MRSAYSLQFFSLTLSFLSIPVPYRARRLLSPGLALTLKVLLNITLLALPLQCALGADRSVIDRERKSRIIAISVLISDLRLSSTYTNLKI